MKLESLTVHEDNLRITNNHINIQMPSHWKSVRLEEICLDKPQNGAFIKSPQLGEGTLFVNVYDIYQNIKLNWSGVERLLCSSSLLKTYLLRENDLLFVRSSLKLEGVGQCCLIGHLDEPAIFDCHLMRVSPDIAKVDPSYLAYYFSSHVSKRDLIARSKTTTMTTINQNTLAKSLVSLPSLPEQRAIAHILQTAQQAIQTLRKELELERERKAALMHHLFTHGTRNEPTKQSEVGEIPESWKIEKLEKVIDGEAQNGAFIKSPQWGTGTLYANVYDIYQNTRIDLGSLQRVECPNEWIKRYALKKNDLLFVRSSLKRDGVGQCCLVKDLPEPAIFDCHLIRLAPDTLIVDPLYVAYYFLSKRGRDNLIARSKTTTMTTLNQKALLEIVFPLPSSKDEQQNIAAILQACDTKTEALEKEIALHEELFRTLLDELMTGRISTLPLIEQLEKGISSNGQRTSDRTGTID